MVAQNNTVAATEKGQPQGIAPTARPTLWGVNICLSSLQALQLLLCVRLFYTFY